MDHLSEDIMTELARLERAAIASDCGNDRPALEKIHQWQALFKYSFEQAAEKIKQRSTDIGRLVITDDLWEDIREEEEARGFDKDAYEHFLDTRPKNPARKPANRHL